MKAKKSYENGGKVGRRSTPGTALRSRMMYAEKKERKAKRLASAKEQSKKKLEEDRAARRYSGSTPGRGLTMDQLKEQRMRRKSEMEAGGRIGAPKDISGMGRFGRKLKKLKPIGPKKIDSGVSMDKTLKKSAVEVDNKKKRRKKRRKFEMGGNLSAPNVNLRGEGKKKKKKKPAQGMVYAGPQRPERMEKITPKGPDVIGLAQKVKPGTIKKSSAKIPVPAKKKRRLRRK